MPEPCQRAHVAVIGGGAAGLMAAIAAAMASPEPLMPAATGGLLTVILLEKQDRVGRKILSTGNGRCNLSNDDLSLQHFHGEDPSFAQPALDQYSGLRTIGFFRSLGLLCRTEEGRIYPYSLQASAVLDILRQAASRLGVRTETNFAVNKLKRLPQPSSGFELTAADGRSVQATCVVAATGGLAAPGLGCDGSGYALLGAFGHRRTAVFPALVQIRTETGRVKGLSGIKFEGTATVLHDGRPVRTAAGEILFTDYGLSGPPLLELSRTVAAALLAGPNDKVELSLDLLPEMNERDIIDWLAFRRDNDPELEMAELLTGLIHKKLGQSVLKDCLPHGCTLASPASCLGGRELSRLADQLKRLSIRATGTRDWTQAQVTAGGLATGDFDPLTLQSRLQPGLFAAGELLDIDGDCGGYNLQWAWSSGQSAGHHAMLAALDSANFR